MGYIHRYWDDPDTTPVHASWTTKVIENLHPDDELKDWTRDDVPDHILSLFDELDVSVITEDRPRHHANIFRWWALGEYGGIWMDHDVMPLVNLQSPNRPYTAAIGTQRNSSVLCFPEHDKLVEVMRHAIDLKSRTSPFGTRSMDASGDHVLNRYMNPSVWARQLPFDRNGRPPEMGPHTQPWAIHYWNTASTERD